MAKNTTTEPRTQSAGLAMKSFSKIVIFIFSIEKKKKPLTGRLPMRGLFVIIKHRSTTATNRTVADNLDYGNNNAVDAVEELLHCSVCSKFKWSYRISQLLNRVNGQNRSLPVKFTRFNLNSAVECCESPFGAINRGLCFSFAFHQMGE